MGKHRIKARHNVRVSTVEQLDLNLCTQFVCGGNFDVWDDKLKVTTCLEKLLHMAVAGYVGGEAGSAGPVCSTLMSKQAQAPLFALSLEDGLGASHLSQWTMATDGV